jgi:hypothetical protein
MSNELPVSDPKSIWQNQPTEALRMSADQLRLRAQKLQRKTRFEVLRTTVIGIALCGFFGLAIANAHQIVARWGLGPLSLWSIRIGYGVLSVWCLYAPYQEYKWFWPRRLAPDAALSTTLQAYRTGLEKRLRSRQQFAWGLAKYAFVGAALVIAPMLIKALVVDPRLLANLAPLFALIAAWWAVVFTMSRRQLKLQQEIEALRAFEREYQL